MKRAFLLVTMLSLAVLARADDQTQAVQQALKEQGFYYGSVDGQPGAETDAAIRRYQIRQGLDVTGKLDAPTLASLNLGGGASTGSNTVEAVPSPASDSADSQPAPTATPPPAVVESDHDFLRNQATPAPADEAPPRAVPVTPEAPQPPPAPGVYEGQSVPPQYAYFFRKTPYETAPPVVQRTTVQRAQMRLAREGYFRGVTDGELSDRLSHAISAYQSEEDLKKTGRLDMDTLDDMNLLPGPSRIYEPPGPPPGYGPPVGPPPGGVYRGIWIH